MNKSILLQVGVKIFLKNKSGKYLLLRRSPVRYPNIANFWDIAGGRINPGTTLLENLRREVKEETKLKISGIPKLMYVQDIIRGKEKHIVRLTFTGSTSGQPILDGDHTDFKWLTLGEMLHVKRLDEFTREVIKRKLVT